MTDTIIFYIQTNLNKRRGNPLAWSNSSIHWIKSEDTFIFKLTEIHKQLVLTLNGSESYYHSFTGPETLEIEGREFTHAFNEILLLHTSWDSGSDGKGAVCKSEWMIDNGLTKQFTNSNRPDTGYPGWGLAWVHRIVIGVIDEEDAEQKMWTSTDQLYLGGKGREAAEWAKSS